MRKSIGMVLLGLGGLVAAIALTVGALALAGDDVGSVVQPTLPSPSSPSSTPQETRSPSPSVDDHGGDDGTATPSASVDDHGGGGSGSDDHSGSGSGSGSGSNSGSGSSNSGSGSDDD